jgi:hypothetical protein
MEDSGIGLAVLPETAARRTQGQWQSEHSRSLTHGQFGATPFASEVFKSLPARARQLVELNADIQAPYPGFRSSHQCLLQGSCVMSLRPRAHVSFMAARSLIKFVDNRNWAFSIYQLANCLISRIKNRIESRIS